MKSSTATPLQQTYENNYAVADGITGSRSGARFFNSNHQYQKYIDSTDAKLD